MHSCVQELGSTASPWLSQEERSWDVRNPGCATVRLYTLSNGRSAHSCVTGGTEAVILCLQELSIFSGPVEANAVYRRI